MSSSDHTCNDGLIKTVPTFRGTTRSFKTWLEKTNRKKGEGKTSVIQGLSRSRMKVLEKYLDFEVTCPKDSKKSSSKIMSQVDYFPCSDKVDYFDHFKTVVVPEMRPIVHEFRAWMEKTDGLTIDVRLIEMYFAWIAICKDGAADKYVGDSRNMMIYPSDMSKLKKKVKSKMKKSKMKKSKAKTTVARTSRKRKR